MNDDMVKALAEMEDAGWGITGGNRLPEYRSRKAELGIDNNTGDTDESVERISDETRPTVDDELLSEIDDYVDDIRYDNEVPFVERLESAKKSIHHLILADRKKHELQVRIDESRDFINLLRTKNAGYTEKDPIVLLENYLAKLTQELENL